ncbi:MAG: ABC transporter permease [Oscillospiraceae bacterium]
MEKETNGVAKTSSLKKFGKKLFSVRELTILTILILFCSVLAVTSENFMSLSNFRVILTGLSYEMIVCAFMAITLIGGMIDFSVGSVLGLGGFICSLLLLKGINVWICILITLVIGFLLGSVNGIIVSKLGILPMVGTMGTWMAYKGLGLALIKNQSIGSLPSSIKVFGQKWEILGIPFSIVLMVVVCFVAWFLLKYVPFFHQAFYIGENRESATLAGISTKKFTVVSYALTGMMASLAGIMSISRFGSAPSTMGQGLEFKMVTALLIGGVSFSGGGGSIFGAFLGALMMQIITNALAMFNIESNLQNVVVGIILIVAVAIDEYNQKRRRGA